jgi:uncharacterized protein YbjT (DUF2867 family)
MTSVVLGKIESPKSLHALLGKATTLLVIKGIDDNADSPLVFDVQVRSSDLRYLMSGVSQAGDFD